MLLKFIQFALLQSVCISGRSWLWTRMEAAISMLRSLSKLWRHSVIIANVVVITTIVNTIIIAIILSFFDHSRC